MRVYLCAAMTSLHRNVPDIEALLAAVEAAGHEVPTRHVAAPDARELDRELTDQDLTARDLGWLAGSDAVIAEVTTPSHGVGVEVAHAVMLGKPVLLLHRHDAVVSRLLTGLSGAKRETFASPEEAAQHATGFLARLA